MPHLRCTRQQVQAGGVGGDLNIGTAVLGKCLVMSDKGKEEEEMNESFIRYYINREPYSAIMQLRRLLPRLSEFNGWQWIFALDFNYEESFGFLPGTNASEIECIKRKSIAIIENRNPDAVIRSLIWEFRQEIPATVIDDILTLFSIAKCKYIHARAQEVLEGDGKLHIIERPIAQPSILEEIICQEELENFIISSFSSLKQEGWKKDTGFIPSIHWYAQAQRLFRAGIFNLECSLYWIVLEVLAGAYVQRIGLAKKIQNKKKRVSELIKSRGFDGNSWSFLDDAIEDWYQLRNFAFHQGELPTWTQQKFEQRWRQLAEFTSFMLADILQIQSQTYKNQIGARLSSY